MSKQDWVFLRWVLIVILILVLLVLCVLVPLNRFLLLSAVYTVKKVLPPVDRGLYKGHCFYLVMEDGVRVLQTQPLDATEAIPLQKMTSEKLGTWVKHIRSRQKTGV